MNRPDDELGSAADRSEPARRARSEPARRVRSTLGTWVARLERELEGALQHFGVALREGTTVRDLAGALATLIEGVWLNQCLTTRHPADPSQPISAMLVRSGRMLWRGATVG